MNFILENYLIIVLVGLFFVFALIGYLIDMLRKSNDIKKDEVPNIKPVEITNINDDISNIEIPTVAAEKDENTNADELLENYDKEIK